MSSVPWRSLGLALGTPILLLVLWEIASRGEALDPLFFPAPSAVFEQWWLLLREDGLLTDIRVSVVRLLLGFALGAVPGVAAGMAMGLWGPVRTALLPLVTALYPIPRIAILPLVLVIFGIGESGKLFMVAFSVFFLMLLEQYLSVAWPGALPSIFTGARLALGFALIVIVGTEFLASNEGVGARIWMAYTVLDIETMYAGLLTTALMGWSLNLVVGVVERWALPWQTR
jgi:NitT/TauT family transport system permease protein